MGLWSSCPRPPSGDAGVGVLVALCASQPAASQPPRDGSSQHDPPLPSLCPVSLPPSPPVAASAVLLPSLASPSCECLHGAHTTTALRHFNPEEVGGTSHPGSGWTPRSRVLSSRLHRPLPPAGPQACPLHALPPTCPPGHPSCPSRSAVSTLSRREGQQRRPLPSGCSSTSHARLVWPRSLPARWPVQPRSNAPVS